MTESFEVRREGIRVGLIAAFCVAGFYAVFDFLAARGPLYTINLLGKAVFRGARDPAILQLPVPNDVGAMLLYTLLHVVLSLGIGLFVTWLIARVERHPSEAGRILLVVLGGFAVTVVVVGFLTGPMRPLLPWWSIVVANTLAMLFAGAWLVARHPVLKQRLMGRPG